jgi:hypothetical protein
MAAPAKEPVLEPAALASLGKLSELQLTELAWSAAHIVEQEQKRMGVRRPAEADESHVEHILTEEEQEILREGQRKDIMAILRTMVALRDHAMTPDTVQNMATSPNPWDASNPFYYAETKELIDLIPSAIRLAQKFSPAPAPPAAPEKAEALTPLGIFTKNPVLRKTPVSEPAPQAAHQSSKTTATAHREKKPPATRAAKPTALLLEAKAAVHEPALAQTIDTQMIRRIAQGEYLLAAFDRDSLRELFIATASYFREQTHATYSDIGQMAGRGKNWYNNMNARITSITTDEFIAFAQKAAVRLEQAQAAPAAHPAQNTASSRGSSKATSPAALPPLPADTIAQLQSIVNGSYQLATLDRIALRQLFIATADTFRAHTAATYGDIAQMAERGQSKNWYSNMKGGFTSVTVTEFKSFARKALERWGIPLESVAPQATPPFLQHSPQPPLQQSRSRESTQPLPELFISDHPIAPVPKAWLKNHATAVELLKIKMHNALPKKSWPQIDAALEGLQTAADVPRGQANTLGYAMTALQGGLSDSHFATVRDVRGAALLDWKSNANLQDSSDNLHDFVKANGAFNGRVSDVLDSFTRILALHWSERMRKTQAREDTLRMDAAGTRSNGNGGHASDTHAAQAASPTHGSSQPWAIRTAPTARAGEWTDYVAARAAGVKKDRGSA